MSTNDVPGAVSGNRDVLAMGCWAEADDKSLIFVKSTEGGRVIFEMYDPSTTPLTMFQDAMTEIDFKKTFSYDPAKADTVTSGGKKVPMAKWTWHDKTPFPWDRAIKAGAQAGAMFASAGDLLGAADNIRKSQARVVAEALGLKAQEVLDKDIAHMAPSEKSNLGGRLARAIEAGLKELTRDA